MREIDILEYLPQFLREVREIQAHAEAENPEVNRLWEEVYHLWDDQYLYTMSEDGCKRWEKMLKIVPHVDDTLEERRFRIITRLNTRFSYTYPRLIESMDSMLGRDFYLMERYILEFVLWVRISLKRKKQFYDVKAFIREIIPQNIYLDIDLLWNTHRTLHPYTHETLTKGTHRQLREEPLDELLF